MNKTISNILVFVSGVAVGSFTAWRLTKKYYADLANAEIKDVVNHYSKRAAREEKEKVSEAERVEYKDIVRESGYNNDEEGDAATIEDDEPYVISPDEFGELTYETITYTYYADRVLADDVDDIVDDVAGTIGLNSLLHFGEYEDDCVHVRNDRLETDFEVLLDSRSYWGDIKGDS